MKKHLFLTGPACSGKSALLRETLGEMLLQAGGYCTAMDLADDGALLGCSLFPAAAAGGAAGFERERFLDFSAFPPRHDSEVFRTTGVQLLEESAWYPFAVIDEFGGFDLIIPQFRKALENYRRHDPSSPLLLGNILPTDIIKPAKQTSLLDKELKLF